MRWSQSIQEGLTATASLAMGNLWTTLSHHVRFEEGSLTLSWQSLAAMFTISSILVTGAMIYLRAVWGKDLTSTASSLSEKITGAQVVIGDRVRSEIKEALTPLERRVERLEDADRGAD